MAINYKRLYTGRPGTAVETLVSSTAGQRLLKQIVLSNNTATVATVTLYAVPSGGTAGPDNVLCPTVSVPANGAIPWSFAEFVLDPGDTVQGLQATSGAVTVHIHGLEVS